MLMTMFDKSFIHAINEDEAAVFDIHFLTNITPLFFVEVLGDLEKADVTPERRSSLVRSLAAKTPLFRSYPNVSHVDLVRHELLGYPIKMRGLPLVGGGRRVESKEGLGTVFDESPEAKARDRWRDGKFEETEFAMAKAWRDTLAQAPGAMDRLTGGNANRYSFSNLDAIKRHADHLIDHDGRRFTVLKASLTTLGIDPQFHEQIINRWKAMGGPPFREFAPYARHVAGVDLFRILGMASSHIAPDKTSNYVDMAYLYYLPFCEVFISGDKLHRRCAPLFLNERQEFVWGHDLRPALAQLVEEYLAHPQINELGLIGVAPDIPADSFIGPLYDRLRPGRREAMGQAQPRLTPEQEKILVQQVKAAAEAPPAGADANLIREDRSITFTRMVPGRRGRFPFLPRKITE